MSNIKDIPVFSPAYIKTKDGEIYRVLGMADRAFGLGRTYYRCECIPPKPGYVLEIEGTEVVKSSLSRDDLAMKPVSTTGLHVKAKVALQRWERDVAYPNGEIEFDAAPVLDRLNYTGLQRVNALDPGTLDNVFYDAMFLGLVEDYGGPFELELDEDDLDAYLRLRGIE